MVSKEKLMNDKSILILGAGKFQRLEGADHHDIYNFPGINLTFDLNQEKWPIPMESYDVIICDHVTEHLQSLIHFMDEAWRILKPNGYIEIRTPNAGVNFDLTHSDPSHIRCYRKHSFTNYFSEEGIAKFGYTDKAWKFNLVHTYRMEITDDCVYVNATPIK